MLRINNDEANFQHIQHRVRLQGAVCGFGDVFAAFGRGEGFQDGQLLLGVRLQSAHIQPLVKGRAGPAAQHRFPNGIGAVRNSLQRDMHIQLLHRIEGGIAIGEGHIKPLAQGIQMGKMPVVIQQDPVTFTLPGGKPAFTFSHKGISQLPQERQRVVAGLGDAGNGERAQTTEEQFLGQGGFPHPVGQRPIAEAIQPVIVFQDVLYDIAGLKAGIVQQVLLRGGCCSIRSDTPAAYRFPAAAAQQAPGPQSRGNRR